MPRLSRWFVRVSLVYLAVGFSLGALILAQKAVAVTPLAWRLLPAHVEFLVVGWTIQFAMGVAFWILPRLAGGAGRGNEAAAWWTFALINVGVLLAGLGPALDAPALVTLWGRIAEVGAATAFAVNAWLRVRRPSLP